MTDALRWQDVGDLPCPRCGERTLVPLFRLGRDAVDTWSCRNILCGRTSSRTEIVLGIGPDADVITVEGRDKP